MLCCALVLLYMYTEKSCHCIHPSLWTYAECTGLAEPEVATGTEPTTKLPLGLSPGMVLLFLISSHERRRASADVDWTKWTVIVIHSSKI